MNSSEPTIKPLYTISAVERDTGLSKDTLRVWEKRYGFPQPERDEYGERVYTQQEMEKLRALKRLIDRGHRPSKIIGSSLEELKALVDPDRHTDAALIGSDDHRRIIDLVRAHNVPELRQELGNALVRQGLASFLVNTVAPLNRLVGDAWMRGQVEIFEEHLYTETMQGLLRNAIASIPQHGRPPKVLLTTFPNELHSLGLLMAEAMFAIEGATCVSLGPQTPIFDIVLASEANRADVVALSFSEAFPANQALDGIEELRAKLPQRVAIWVGGRNPGLARRPVAGVQSVSDLDSVAAALDGWRSAHRAA